MRFVASIVICCLGSAGGSSGQSPAVVDWEHANQATVRLRPSAFPGLATSVIQERERRGCSIPQAFSSSTLTGAD